MTTAATVKKGKHIPFSAKSSSCPRSKSQSRSSDPGHAAAAPPLLTESSSLLNSPSPPGQELPSQHWAALLLLREGLPAARGPRCSGTVCLSSGTRRRIPVLSGHLSCQERALEQIPTCAKF